MDAAEDALTPEKAADLDSSTNAAVQKSAGELCRLLDDKHPQWRKQTGLVRALSKDGQTEWIRGDCEDLWKSATAQEARALLGARVPAHARLRVRSLSGAAPGLLALGSGTNIRAHGKRPAVSNRGGWLLHSFGHSCASGTAHARAYSAGSLSCT